MFCSEQDKKESDENSIRTRQQRNIDERVLMLAPPLSSSRPWDNLPLLRPLLWLPIHQERHYKAAASVVVLESSTPQLLSLIPRTCCLFLGLCWRLRRRCWVRGPVLLCQWHCRRHQYPKFVNTPAHLTSETFTCMHCLFFFLS